MAPTRDAPSMSTPQPAERQLGAQAHLLGGLAIGTDLLELRGVHLQLGGLGVGH